MLVADDFQVSAAGGLAGSKEHSGVATCLFVDSLNAVRNLYVFRIKVSYGMWLDVTKGQTLEIRKAYGALKDAAGMLGSRRRIRTVWLPIVSNKSGYYRYSNGSLHP